MNNNFNIYILISYPVTISGSISSNIIGYHEQNNPIKLKKLNINIFFITLLVIRTIVVFS